MSKQRKFGSRKGATFIEYALLAGLVAIVVAAAAMFFGEDIKNLFGATGEKVTDVQKGVNDVKLKTSFDDVNKRTGGGSSSSSSGGSTSNP